MTRSLELVAVALWVLAALTTLVLGGRRLALGRRERRREDLERRLRPLALALVDGEEVDVGTLDRDQSLALAAILERYARKLSGEARERIADFFERRGDVERELDELRSRRRMRRAAAAFTLGDMGSRTAIPALIAALDDRARDVRSAAARSLGRLEAELAVPRLVRSLAGREVPRALAGHALLSIGAGAAPHLRALAAAEDADERAVAMELLGYAGEASDGALLAGALEDPAPEARAAAARSLGRLGARAEADALRSALGDPAPFVRTAAAHALGQIADRDAVERLVRQALADEYDPARAAAQALAAISPRETSRLAATPDASVHLREAAAALELGLA
jgi:HEAT repeat protein